MTGSERARTWIEFTARAQRRRLRATGEQFRQAFAELHEVAIDLDASRLADGEEGAAGSRHDARRRREGGDVDQPRTDRDEAARADVGIAVVDRDAVRSDR